MSRNKILAPNSKSDSWAVSIHKALGSLENWSVTTVSATSTLKASDGELVLCANTADVVLTLPNAVNVGKGFKYIFIKTTADAKKVTLDGNSAETINGAATNAEMDAQYDRIGIVSDGANWLIWEKAIS